MTTDNNICCRILRLQLEAMETLVRSLKDITREFDHREMGAHIAHIEQNIVAMYAQIQRVEELEE